MQQIDIHTDVHRFHEGLGSAIARGRYS